MVELKTLLFFAKEELHKEERSGIEAWRKATTDLLFTSLVGKLFCQARHPVFSSANNEEGLPLPRLIGSEQN
jgi:hypothetical protein